MAKSRRSLPKPLCFVLGIALIWPLGTADADPPQELGLLEAVNGESDLVSLSLGGDLRRGTMLGSFEYAHYANAAGGGHDEGSAHSLGIGPGLEFTKDGPSAAFLLVKYAFSNIAGLEAGPEITDEVLGAKARAWIGFGFGVQCDYTYLSQKGTTFGASVFFCLPIGVTIKGQYRSLAEMG